MSRRTVVRILILWSAVLTATATPVAAQECVTDATALCLNNERFRIEVRWRTPEGEAGSGRAVRLSDDTGYFWFFRESNVEVLLKALDGRKLNGHFWVFFGALSNLEHTLTVTDTRTGVSRTYRNEAGRFASTGDTLAFPIETEATTPAVAGLALCLNGAAAAYPCRNVDLLAFVPFTDLGADGSDDRVSDHWGWTDPATGREYVLVGLQSGTALVDISRPTEPVLLGTLDAEDSLLRDIKTFGNYAFVVADGAGQHGLQVFDLTRLRDVESPPQTFSPDTVYDGFGQAHNLAINEESAFAYAVDTDTCGGGLHMVDLRNPLEPTFAGCFAQDGETHDAQCVIYRGADVAHREREICFACNEDTLTIVDVTDKEAPIQLSRTSYEGAGFTHQGWLTADHRHFLLDDEADEFRNGHNTRTYIWDVSDLDAPFVAGTYTGPTTATDHNLYIHRGLVFEANYQAGLRILDLGRIDEARLDEVAFFDTVPDSNAVGGGGAWTAYPFFASGVVTVSTTSDGAGVTLEHQGLFVLRPNLAGFALAVPSDVSALLSGVDLELRWRDSSTGETGFRIWRGIDGDLPVLHAEVGADVNRFVDQGLTPGTTYTYQVSTLGEELESQRSDPFTLTIPTEAAETSGLCVDDATSICLNRNRFRVEVAWRDPFGSRGSGEGRAVRVSGDTSTFWFFNESNVELALKVLDGSGLNGHFWVFYGALSNVEYTIIVTDTQKGIRRLYFNSAGRFASRGDIEAL